MRSRVTVPTVLAGFGCLLVSAVYASVARADRTDFLNVREELDVIEVRQAGLDSSARQAAIRGDSLEEVDRLDDLAEANRAQDAAEVSKLREEAREREAFADLGRDQARRAGVIGAGLIGAGWAWATLRR